MAIWVPVVVVTVMFGIVGLVLPFLAPKGPNRGLVQTMLVMTAVCCYMFWLLAFLHQINPLIGPELSTEYTKWLNHTWGASAKGLIY